jgi:long-chain acyl-CoA synthetase
MSAATPDTIPHRLFELGPERGSAPAYYVRADGRWKPTSWRDYADEVKTAARALIALGVPDDGTVSILGFNRPEWTIFDVAAMAIGAAPAGVYTTCAPAEVAYIVAHAESRVMLVENHEQLDKVRDKRAEMPELETVVLMKGAEPVDEDWVITWEEFEAKAAGVTEDELQKRLDALRPEQLATLIYTSGTTGPPKGVMLSHDNLAWTSLTAKEMNDTQPGDCVLSYLPLSHIAEQMFTIHGAITTGASVYYAESIDKVPDNLKEVQPTMFFGVPRIWEKFHAKISERIESATGAKKALINFVMRVCSARNKLVCAGKSPGLFNNIQYRIADKLVLSKLKPAIGLGRARLCVSGAAPISAEILEFMASIDVVIHEVYGQSEDCGPTSYNRPRMTRLGTVGPAFDGVTIKIADDGEILVKGPNVFLGYYKDKEATAETLIDGWLHSGDLGKLDADGYLSISGRKKEIIITAGGKNIAPKNIEGALTNTRLINEAVVIGDQRKFLSALVTLDEEVVQAYVADNGLDSRPYHEQPKIAEEIERAFAEVNKDLAQVEKVKKWTILPRNLTIEDGELTPTLKVKRRVVHEHFAAEIEAMYNGAADQKSA